MVAARHQTQQERGNGFSRPCQTRQRIHWCYRRLVRQRGGIVNVAICFVEQAWMYPLQCSAAIERLNTLRRLTHSTRSYLSTLDPEITRQLRPYGCMAVLDMLEYLLAEITLTIAMFAPICQIVSYDRIELHLYIRSLFPRLLRTMDDVTTHLVALLDSERSESQNLEVQK